MKIRINGEDKVVQDGLSLDALLDLFKVGRDGIAVELNRVIIRKADLKETPVSEGDVVEIVRMVGGG